MNQARILWQFSRPHTIIGSVVSICTLYVIVCSAHGEAHPFMLLFALVMGIACNVFIVGINQVADVELDRINKPWLPIASGALSVRQAMVIVYTALVVCLGIASFVSPYLFGIIALAAGIGWAYSMPPFHLKRHHLSAAVAITTVRGVLVNVGGFMVFNYLVNRSLVLPENVKILAAFIIVFSIVISWFKDLPDVEGDARYHIRTLAILYSPRTAVIAGHLLVGTAYLFTIAMKYAGFRVSATPSMETSVLLYGHIVLFALFIMNAFSIRLGRYSSIRKFYKRFWWFFFAEYVLYLVAYVAPM